MDHKLERDFSVLTSTCDAQGKLSIRSVFDIFMDMAAEHAALLGVGYYSMLERRCFWVAVRTRVKIYERPQLGSHITAVTWPGKPGRAKSDRFYRLLMEDRVLAEGRTEWAVQDIDTGAVRRIDSYGYPMDLQHSEERVCGDPFLRFKGMDILPEDLAAHYTVQSSDIDVGHHMNNVAYIRMLLGTLSTKDLEKMEITEVEISYRQACYEGEELRIFRKTLGRDMFYQVVKPDGETAVQAVIKI